MSEGVREGYVVAVTHGLQDATRVMLALVTASRLPTLPDAPRCLEGTPPAIPLAAKPASPPRKARWLDDDPKTSRDLVLKTLAREYEGSFMGLSRP